MNMLRDLVLIRLDELTTASGLVLAVDSDSTVIKSRTAVVVATGPGKRSEKTGTLIPMTVKPGDQILINKHDGQPFELDGEEKLMIILQRDILGICAN
jgi:chaperonin GroES